MKCFDHRSGNRLEIDGARIYYEIAGSLEAPPLLLLHGGLGDIEDFNEIASTLSGDFKLIGIDMRGHGGSTLGAQPLTYDRCARDVQHVLEHLGVDKASVIGFSDGGIIAYRLACMAQSKIDKLVTIGADWELKEGDPLIDLFSSVTGASWRQKFPASYDAYQERNPEPAFDRLVSAAVGMWVDTTASGYPGERVSRISRPLLIVRGDDDHLVSIDRLVELQRRVQGAALLNIPFAGHVAFRDQPDVFLTCLRQFLAR